MMIKLVIKVKIRKWKLLMKLKAMKKISLNNWNRQLILNKNKLMIYT